MDQIACVGLRRQKLFCEGHGSPRAYARMVEIFEARDPAPRIQVNWTSQSERAGILTRVGWFTSPGARSLPPEARRAWIQMVQSAATRESPGDTPVCVHFPATGDQGFQRRYWMMGVPLARRGIASVNLEIPYYGRRRPEGQSGILIRTLSDFWKMCAYTALEGRALVRWLRESGHESVGVTGVSMGGGFSALMGATIREPLAVIPCIAGHTPAPVFTEALLRHSVDWGALQAGRGLEEARDVLCEKLGAADVTRYQPPVRPEAAYIVGAAHDAVVPPGTALELHRHWEGSTLRWVPSGHVGSVLFYSSRFRAAIADAFGALDRAALARNFPGLSPVAVRKKREK